MSDVERETSDDEQQQQLHNVQQDDENEEVKEKTNVVNDSDNNSSEEEEEEEEMPKRKRAKRRGNMFVDVEAEVDDDEEDVEEDDHELLKEDGFIQHEPEEEGDRDDRLHREVDRRREAIDDQDAERLASEYRERYGRSAGGIYRGESSHVPQRLLLPSVHDPNIWGVRCKPGKEKELVRSVLKKKENLQYTKTPLEIFSAFQRDTFSGYVYIEARKQTAVQHALTGFPNVYMQQMILVPIKEYPDMFRVNKSKETELALGSYVRIKRGKYQGDLAIVENISENGLEARLKVVPRLDYGKNKILDTMDGGKRKRTSRPPPRLFSSAEAQNSDQGVQRRGQNIYYYANEEYEDGYLKKDFKINHLITDSVDPRLEEIQKFSSANDEGIDLNAVSESLKQAVSNVSYQAGDQVEVAKGEQAGMQGKVLSTQGNIVTMIGIGGDMNNEKIDMPVENLRKKFSIGDHVRVVNGNYKDDTGMVVQVAKDTVTLISDLSKTEITVFAKDLKAASEIGGAATMGKFELHDLVQLNAQLVGCIVKIDRDSVDILGQDNQLRQVSPSSITMKVTRGNMTATDRNGNEIRVGDTVKETNGEQRQGAILHIHRSTLFLHSRAVSENLGVFVGRSNYVVTVAAKGARGLGGPDLNKMNPALQAGKMMAPPVVKAGGRDRILGQRVTIGKGSQHKGLRGTVRDSTDTEARVELEAKSKVVTVRKDCLLFTSRNGERMSYYDFVQRRPPPPGGSGSNAPPGFNAGGRTPGFNAGGKTPGFNAGGNRTPGFGMGGRTPAWQQAAAARGSQTPAWSGGRSVHQPSWKTPSHNPTKTPAWNGGGKTPAMGNATPAYGFAGGATPHFGGGAREREAPTPGFYNAPTPALSAPTPGVYRDDEAPTPYDAKTPGLSAATPGVWAEDDAETPKYEPNSP